MTLIYIFKPISADSSWRSQRSRHPLLISGPSNLNTWPWCQLVSKESKKEERKEKIRNRGGSEWPNRRLQYFLDCYKPSVSGTHHIFKHAALVWWVPWRGLRLLCLESTQIFASVCTFNCTPITCPPAPHISLSLTHTAPRSPFLHMPPDCSLLPLVSFSFCRFSPFSLSVHSSKGNFIHFILIS